MRKSLINHIVGKKLQKITLKITKNKQGSKTN